MGDMRRMDSWIDKGVNLKTILRDQRALDAFRNFCANVHATENLSFYVAVEFFKTHFVGTPQTSMGKKTFSLADLRPGPAEMANREKESAFLSNKARHSMMMHDILTPENVAKLSLSESQTSLLKSAARIFETFLEDGAVQWACVDSKLVDEVRNVLKTGTGMDSNLFDKCQASVFQSMQSDLLPRFLKQVFEDPDAFASGKTRSKYALDAGDDGAYVRELIMGSPQVPASPKVSGLKKPESFSSSRVSMKLEPPPTIDE